MIEYQFWLKNDIYFKCFDRWLFFLYGQEIIYLLKSYWRCRGSKTKVSNGGVIRRELLKFYILFAILHHFTSPLSDVLMKKPPFLYFFLSHLSIVISLNYFTIFFKKVIWRSRQTGRRKNKVKITITYEHTNVYDPFYLCILVSICLSIWLYRLNIHFSIYLSSLLVLSFSIVNFRFNFCI